MNAAIRELELSHLRFSCKKAELDNLFIYGRRLSGEVEESEREVEGERGKKNKGGG